MNRFFKPYKSRSFLNQSIAVFERIVVNTNLRQICIITRFTRAVRTQLNGSKYIQLSPEEYKRVMKLLEDPWQFLEVEGEKLIHPVDPDKDYRYYHKLRKRSTA